MKKALKIIGRILLVLLIVLVVAGIVFAIIYSGMMKTDHELIKNGQIENAILYTVEDGKLEYNVIYYGDVTGAAVTDTTGSGIDSPAKLQEVLGVADAPAEVLSADPGQRTIGKAVTADIVTDEKGNILSLTVTSVAERPVVGIS